MSWGLGWGSGMIMISICVVEVDGLYGIVIGDAGLFAAWGACFMNFMDLWQAYRIGMMAWCGWRVLR